MVSVCSCTFVGSTAQAPLGLNPLSSFAVTVATLPRYAWQMVEINSLKETLESETSFHNLTIISFYLFDQRHAFVMSYLFLCSYSIS